MEFKVNFKEANLRLDKVLSIYCENKSRSYLSKVIDDGLVKVNGEVAKPSLKVKENDLIEITYPEDKTISLKGEDIPYLARIVSIADTFDAMTTNRPYRKALTIEESLKEIERCKDTQFDPILADLFIKMVRRDGF